MRTIYKYTLSVKDEQTLNIPLAEGRIDSILCIDAQRGVPCLWAMVDTTYPATNVVVSTRGTGHSCAGIKQEMYIGTYQLQYGDIVFHVFAEMDE